MVRFIIRRLLSLPVVLIGLSILIFLMLQLLDPAERAALYVPGGVLRTSGSLQSIIRTYGLDKPIYIQYINWLGRTLHGNLGWSVTAQQPVLSAIISFFPATMELALWSFIPIIVGGIYLGILAAIHHDHWQDHLARIFSIVGYSFPTFVFGLLVLMIFYAALQWFPPGRLSNWATSIVFSPSFHRYTGMYTVDALLNGRLNVFLDALRHLFLPAITLAYVQWALILRVMRSSMLDVISQDYVRTARSKGLPERTVLNRHARPNALIPVATAGGLLLVGLLNGAVVTETVFNFHGMGWFVGTAALQLDAVSVLGATLFDGMLIVVANLVVDIMYAYLDPRIRLQ